MSERAIVINGRKWWSDCPHCNKPLTIREGKVCAAEPGRRYYFDAKDYWLTFRKVEQFLWDHFNDPFIDDVDYMMFDSNDLIGERGVVIPWVDGREPVAKDHLLAL